MNWEYNLLNGHIYNNIPKDMKFTTIQINAANKLIQIVIIKAAERLLEDDSKCYY